MRCSSNWILPAPGLPDDASGNQRFRSGSAEGEEGALAVEGQRIECSGRLRTIESLAPYFEQGIRKVIVAAPVKEEGALNVVVGVNDDPADLVRHDILTAASYETRPLVSVDYRDDPRSGIVDAPSTMVVNGTQVKVLAWYDNEWGYANRLVELARTVAAADG